MPDRKFSVVRDADGDQKDIGLKQWPDLQAQGYRIADVAGYDAAMSEGVEPESAPELAPAEAAMAEQTSVDASKLAAEQYPASKPAAADKPRESKR